MNFFGHAMVASWADPSPEHVLGSMLPDFEAMTGVPVIEVCNPSIETGMATHHRTDEAFHRTRSFLALSGWALSTLSGAGVRRGTARAVAHIATEMFLDGHLVENGDRPTPYLRALALQTDDAVHWQDGGDAFDSLRGRLNGWGVPTDYADPPFVFVRLRDALGRRPNLAIQQTDAVRVARCLPELQRRVRQQALELLDELQDALGFGS